MKNQFKISSYCHVKQNKISLNGTIFFSAEAEESKFLKKAYKDLDINYSKFFKMDKLSQLAFLAADVLLQHENISEENQENIALVMGNKASSLDTDRKHQDSIQDKASYYPSPAVFVYTLPNIMLGEISIKYKLYSENSFFVFENFKTNYFYNYTQSLIDDKKADKILCGWVNVDDEDYEAFLYLVTPNGNLQHTEQQINTLYNELWKL
ncbi:beta-ketoacyl-[acyl-carrier-protein] synthase family protein [Neotamlana sedimentorum]|nr:3-oxoacyl-ACP synthase [Tamlana sedimentorum]